MAVSAGEIEATLRLRDELTAGLKIAGRQISATGAELEKLGTRLQSVGTALLPISAAVGAATGAVFKFGKDFQKTMAQVGNLTDIGAKNIDSMSDAMLDMVPSVATGPGALADAMLIVASTGIKGAEALDILETSAKASAVGLGETKEIARTVTAAITAYGKENLDASTAAEVLFKTVREGAANVEEVAGSFGRVIGIAHQMGVSFQEVGGFVATFTRLGVNADEAVTALRGTLNAVLHPAKQSRDALIAVGTSVEELRKNIKEKGLTQALIDLVRLTGDNTDAIGTIIPNVRALSGVLGITGEQAAEAGRIVKVLNEETRDLGDAFAVTAETVDFKWNKAWAQAEKLAISVFNVFKTEFKALTSGLGPLLEKAQQFVDGMKQWSPAARQATAAVTALLTLAVPGFVAFATTAKLLAFSFDGVGLAISGASKLLGPLISAAAAGATTLGEAAVAIGLPWVALVAAITAAGAAIYIFRDDIIDMVRGVEPALASMLDTLSELIGIKGFLGLVEAMKNVATIIKNVLIFQWYELKRELHVKDIETLIGVFDTLGEVIFKSTVPAVFALVPGLKQAALLFAFVKSINPSKLLSDLAAASEEAAAAARGSLNFSTPKLPKLDVGNIQQVGIAIRNLDKDQDDLGKGVAELTDEQKKYNKELADTVAELGGSGAIKKAQLYLDALAKTKGVAMLTKDAQKDVNQVMEDAVAAYEALRQKAPKAVMDVYTATLTAFGGIKQLVGKEGLAGLLGLSGRNGLVGMDAKQLVAKIVPPDLNREMILAISRQPTGNLGPLTDTLGYALKTSVSKAAEDIPDILVKAFTGGGGIEGAMKAIGVKLSQAVLEPMMETLTKVQQRVVGVSAAIASGLGAAIGGGTGAAIAGVSSSIGGAAVAASNFGKEMAKSGVLGQLALGGISVGIGLAVAGVTKLVQHFFGVSQAIQDSRKKLTDFNAELEKLATKQERAEASGEAWKLTVIQVRDAYLATGRTAEDALKAVEAMWDTDNPKRSADAISEVSAVIEQQKAQWDGVGKSISALNKQTEGGIKTQGQFNSVAAIAVATFDAWVKKTGDVAGAIAQLGPTLDALAASQMGLGVAGTQAIQNLLGLRAVTEANKPLMEGIATSTMLLQGLAQAGLLTGDMVTSFGQDAVNQFTLLKAATGDSTQALALMQPELQLLWEHQQKFHDITDEATLALLDEAAAHGVVGEAAKTPQAQMLTAMKKVVSVLEAIATGLGVTLPAAAETGAAGVSRALDGISVPDLHIPITFDVGDVPSGVQVPEFASGSGGFRNFGPSGTLAMLHNREAVVRPGDPDPNGGSGGDDGGGNEDILAALAQQRRDWMFTIPSLIAKQVVVATAKAGRK